VTLKAVNI